MKRFFIGLLLAWMACTTWRVHQNVLCIRQQLLIEGVTLNSLEALHVRLLLVELKGEKDGY